MKLTSPIPCPLANGRSLLIAWLLVTAGIPAQASGTALRITSTGTNTEGLPTIALDWDAISNATYLVQSATSLAPGTQWNTIDTATPTNTTGQFAVPVTVVVKDNVIEPPATFYRLILPQPQIFSVEPAIVAPGAAVDFYVIGQCFPTNGVLQINGVTQAGAVFGSSSLATIPGFTMGAAGNYQVSLAVGGVVVSSFNLVCADAVANPELVLQGPPTVEPPASPSVRSSGHAGEKLGISWETTELKARMAGGGGNPASKDAPAKKGEKKIAAAHMAGGGNGGGDTDEDGGSTLNSSAYHGMPMKVIGNIRARMAGGGGGPVVGAPDPSPSYGAVKSALVSRSNISNNRMAGGGGTGVMPFSGEVQACEVDMAIPGRDLDFVWARTYRSRTGHTATLLGNCWTCSYDVRCAQNTSGGMDVYDGTGRKDSFALGTNGLYTCRQFFREGTLSNNTFTLTFADTGRWVFNPNDSSVAAGKLHQVITRNGSTMALGYDTGGRLAQIVDDLGRTNTVAYDTSGRVAIVTDFTGRSVTYQYYSGAKSDNGSAGDLMSVTSPPVTGTPNGNDFPSGKTTTYTYSKSFSNDRENHLLLTVTDPKGQTAAVFSYEHSSTSTNYLRCIAAQEGTNTASCFTYSAFTSGTPHVPVLPAPMQPSGYCIVNDPVGNVTQYYFDARNRCLIEADYTGRATPGLPVTDTVNRPTGKLRSSDPDYYEARWSWNNDSLCTSETSPGGQQMQYVYQSDFDQATTARKRADCRVVRELASSPVDLNGDGVPDTSERVWHFDYDPHFGSSASTGFRTWRQTVINGGMAAKKKTGTGGTWQDTLSDIPAGAKSVDVEWSIHRAEHRMGGAAYHAVNTKETGISGFTDDGDTGATYHAINTKGTGISGRSADVRLETSLRESPTLPPHGPRESPTKASSGFCISATDPRGNVTTAEYDSNGCMTRFIRTFDRAVSVQDHAELDFAYNTHGQLNAITNAPDANGYRRVDTFTYYTSGPPAGYLQSIAIDESGVHLTSAFEYDPRGNLTRYIDPRTNDWLYTYNALDQCVRAQSPPNISARCATDYFYDANDNLVQCATELRDAADSLAGGQTNRFQYDGLDRLTEIAQAVDASHALTNRLIYNGNNQCMQVLGGDAVSGADPSQTVACQYDERGLLFREIAAPGSTLQSTAQLDYDANGHPTRVSEGLEGTPSVTTIEYDGFGGFGASSPSIENNTAFYLSFTFKLVAVKTMSSAHKWGGRDPQWLADWQAGEFPASLRVSRITDPMGNRTVCFYDANDNLKVVRRFGELNDVPGTNANVRLAESGFQYDALDHCVSAQDMFFNPATQSPIGSGKATTTFAYAPNSACVSVTDALGHTTIYGYDTACRPVSVTDALGNQQSVVCDAVGNPLAVISSEVPAAGGPPQVFAITNVFDSLNRCVSTTDSAGNTGSNAYDSLGRCVQTTDAAGTSTFFSYDLLNRCTLAILDLNHDGKPDLVNDIATTYTWSGSSGNLLAVTDSHTNTTSYAYDSLGRCTSVTSPNGAHHTFAWNSRSDLVSEQDANGTVIAHTYDLNDRCISNNITPGAGVAATTTFEKSTYDGCDRLTGAANNSGNIAFTCDSLGNCVSETLNGLATTSTYDAVGNRLSLTYPGGRILTYAYDALNRCASIASSGQQLASYAYDGPARVSQITYGNGTRAQISYDGFAGPPNATGDHGFGQVRSVRHSVVSGGAVIDARTFGYDADQNKTIRDMTSPFTLGGVAQGMAFQYDPACRLIGTLVTTNGSAARLLRPFLTS